MFTALDAHMRTPLSYTCMSIQPANKAVKQREKQTDRETERDRDRQTETDRERGGQRETDR